MQSTIISLLIFISVGLASSLSIVTGVGIVIASGQLVLGGRASRRRRRRLEKQRVALIKSLVCPHTYKLFGNTCPIPAYNPQEYQDELWTFHQANCIPKEKNDSFVGLFIFAFASIVFILVCFVAL
jgi:hypothetical protein